MIRIREEEEDCLVMEKSWKVNVEKEGALCAKGAENVPWERLCHFCTDLLVLCTLTLCCVYFKASPPKFINVEDVMRLADGVTDMALAHEIAISSEFRLEQIEANPDR